MNNLNVNFDGQFWTYSEPASQAGKVPSGIIFDIWYSSLGWIVNCYAGAHYIVPHSFTRFDIVTSLRSTLEPQKTPREMPSASVNQLKALPYRLWETELTTRSNITRDKFIDLAAVVASRLQELKANVSLENNKLLVVEAGIISDLNEKEIYDTIEYLTHHGLNPERRA